MYRRTSTNHETNTLDIMLYKCLYDSDIQMSVCSQASASSKLLDKISYWRGVAIANHLTQISTTNEIELVLLFGKFLGFL